MTGSLPLEGTKVADFGQFIAGPAVGQMLSDLGASVVKVEPKDGEVSRRSGIYGLAMVRTNNRDKLGLAVDLRSPRGREVAERLIADSDVVIQNMRPGAMERLSLGPAHAQAINPAVVYLSITGFGARAAPIRPGLDIAVQAESGMMSVTGEAEGDPQKIGFTVVDAATAYAATSAVLAALLRRSKTGQGAIIDTSLLEVALHLQGANWVAWFTSGIEPTRSGNGQPYAAPAAELISVKDGKIVVSAYTPDHWQRLCNTVGRPELASDPLFCTNEARLQNREQMRAILADSLGTLTQFQAVEMLSAGGIVAGAVRSYSQVMESPDVERLQQFYETEARGTGSYRYPALPFSIRGLERVKSRGAPAAGEDTRGVLAALGYDSTAVERLVVDGVVQDGSTGFIHDDHVREVR